MEQREKMEEYLMKEQKQGSLSYMSAGSELEFKPKANTNSC